VLDFWILGWIDTGGGAHFRGGLVANSSCGKRIRYLLEVPRVRYTAPQNLALPHFAWNASWASTTGHSRKAKPTARSWSTWRPGGWWTYCLTVRRYAYAESFPERARRVPPPSILDLYLNHLETRLAEGCENAMALWRELQALPQRQQPKSRSRGSRPPFSSAQAFGRSNRKIP
jgi:hypothetical protein